MATFSKLRDESWGVRVEGSKPCPGDRVEVTRKDGGKVTKTIKSVVWSGGGVHLCSTEPDGVQPVRHRPVREKVETKPKARRSSKRIPASELDAETES